MPVPVLSSRLPSPCQRCPLACMGTNTVGGLFAHFCASGLSTGCHIQAAIVPYHRFLLWVSLTFRASIRPELIFTRGPTSLSCMWKWRFPSAVCPGDVLHRRGSWHRGWRSLPHSRGVFVGCLVILWLCSPVFSQHCSFIHIVLQCVLGRTCEAHSCVIFHIVFIVQSLRSLYGYQDEGFYFF